MIGVATLDLIRRCALREQMSIREISRRTGLVRNKVKKYLRSDETEPTYVAKRVSSSKLDPYAEKPATWLRIEAKKRENSGAIPSRFTQSRVYVEQILMGISVLSG